MKKYLFILAALILVAAAGSFIGRAKAAPMTYDVSGWAWSSNIGWISFNSNDVNTGSNGIGKSINSYGVQVVDNGASSNSALSGHAWSSNIGWISFDSSDIGDCNGGAATGAVMDMSSGANSGKVSGWARAIAGKSNPGGWDGCIELSGTNHPSSVNGGGVWVDLNQSSPTYGKFRGYAWDAVMGWMQFNSSVPVSIVPTSPTFSVTCTPSAYSLAPGGTIDFSVTVSNGTPNYTYTLNAGDGSSLVSHAGISASTYNISNIPYALAGDYGPTVTVADGSHNQTASCGTISVAAPSGSLSLKIGKTGSAIDATKTTYSVTKGAKFGLNWTNELSDDLDTGYRCNVIPPTNAPSAWLDWNNANAQASKQLSNLGTSDVSVGSYVFKIDCQSNLDNTHIKAESTLKVRSVDEGEI